MRASAACASVLVKPSTGSYTPAARAVQPRAAQFDNLRNNVRCAWHYGALRRTISIVIRARAHLLSVALALCATAGLLACSSGTGTVVNHPVVAAPPPKDDGQPSEGGGGGNPHSAALEQLKLAKLGRRIDKQGSVIILLPDAEHWTRVKFWGVESLVGYRYGKDHHALVGGFVTHVDDNTKPGACIKSFEDWAMPMVQAFDVEIHHEPPIAVMWHRKIVDVDSVFAKTETIAVRDTYAGTYAAYPVWDNACLIVGVAVPSRGDDDRAREVRDRFAREVLPRVEVLRQDEPKERY
jgi:hypothetical protein